MTIEQTVAPAVLSSARSDVALKQLTTLRVGGPVSQYVETHSEEDLVSVVKYADAQGLPLLVLGGGSNVVASDSAFEGIVVRDRRSGVQIDQVDSCGGGSVTVPAGHNWDDFVVEAIAQGWVGIESLIGIPGSVGAAPVQNIGAYGAEVSNVISSVRVWDRGEQRKRTFALFELEFGYRDSKIKRSMTTPDDSGKVWGPTPRYVVLEVSFQFRLGTRSAPVQYGELARELGIEVGERAPARDIAQAVLKLRSGKGMLVDAFDRPQVAHTAGAQGTLPQSVLTADLDGDGPAVECGLPGSNSLSAEVLFDDARGAAPQYDRWSAGSFFTNPIIAAKDAESLPEHAPRYPVTGALPANTTGPSTGAIDPSLVKTSAAWLIAQSGFDKGFALDSQASKASLSSAHTLALTNRGEATAADIRDLAVAVRDGVRDKFGITLVPEPVFVGFSLDS